MPANHSSVCGPPAQRGFSLLEVLVALLLTTLGVFGAIGLQLNALVSAPIARTVPRRC
ncbi:prepilin-type N-terminal cleavage/methylation domain-containing protein [Halopseudomonas pachastrellae]|nr:prepilin-type N-terminal cleavage/methylation domain-containing protein [Halopseudomonas pachastrellae]